MNHPDYLHGAIDLHVHSRPDIDPRRYDDIELACEAAKAGMSAILIKCHQTSTAERAQLVRKIVPEIDVYGGIVLNETVGGLNPAAVRVALQLGAKEVWMPTRSSRNHRSHLKQPGGLGIFDLDGEILPEVEQILDLIAASDAILGTGHLSPEEGVALARRALQKGVKRILVTHPEWHATFYPFELQRELAAEGVMFERCFVSMTHRCGYVPIQTIERAIGEAGVSNTILCSDLGQPDTPPPTEGLAIFAGKLRAAGFSQDDLHRMMCQNARNLLK